jgi:hypothetical protein
MSLPSQSSRGSGNARSYMSRNKGLNLKPIAIGAAAVAVVAGVVWGISKLGGKSDLGPQSAAAAPAKPLTGPSPIAGLKPTTPTQGAASTPTPPPAPIVATPPAAEPPMLELRQGRPRPETTPGLRNIAGSNPPPPPVAAPLNPPPPAPTVSTAPKTTTAPGAGVPKPSSPLPPANPAPQAQNPSITPGLAADLEGLIASGFQALAAADGVAARAMLSRAVADSRLPEPDKASLREELAKISDDLVFSTRLAPGDPFVMSYSVQSGDSLVKINQKNNLGPDWRLIQRINRMSDAHRLSLGQRLKLIKGPFHCVVNKSAFRLDVWMGPGESSDQWVYVRSFKVGLGENGSTPPGSYIVKKGSKLVNPPWVNPRTGERFDGGDPKNPIGKFWVGLEGVGDASTNTGYGIHGTIDPESIGQQRSMGCVRMATDDIALVFELMGEQVSTVKIQP